MRGNKIKFIESLNQRVKKLDFLNIQLIKISNWFFSLIVLKLIPDILNIGTIWFILLFIIFVLKPFISGLFKRNKSVKKDRFSNTLSFVDLQLINAANWIFAIIIVKIFPGILCFNIIWFIALLVLFSLSPIYVVWFKNDKNVLGFQNDIKQNCPSLTAYQVALMRAAHQVIDKPIVFDDPIAISILGNQVISEIYSETRRFNTRFQSYLRASVIARSRFAEDELFAAIKRGVRQYVILGAGMDTFAYRNPYSLEGLKVFEVDHPATQTWKHQQLNKVNISISKNTIFIPIDFQNQSLAEKLIENGFKSDEPSFFSLLGVTMYLNRRTMMKTMEYISSSLPSGSEIVFDYVISPSSGDFLHQLSLRLLTRRLSRIGEPWVNIIDSNLLIKDLTNIGFTQVNDIGPEEINARFFNNRTDKLAVGNFVHIMKAQI